MRLVQFACIAFLILFTACGSQHEFDPGPPSGWEGEEGRWWQEGVDTSVAFRDLQSLPTMGVDRIPNVPGTNPAVRAMVAQNVKQGLLRLYRNQPEVIDSLFDAHVVRLISEADVSGDRAELSDQLQQDGYRSIGRHFQEPRTRLTLGDDVPVIYPDSLRRQGISGRVSMQVYLNEEGEPLAVMLVDGVHPVLDDLAMEATTEMRWRPAYLMRRGNWLAIPSWARFNINFTTGP